MEVTQASSSSNKTCFIGYREPPPALFLCPLGAGARVTSLGGGRRVSQPPVPEGRTSDTLSVRFITSDYKL